ncbi:MAG: ATP-binding cassette domain-containing protein [Treponema sp.]|nr:ATP-binding cassette domain-containing protein [Treponema sp.]
MDAIVKNEILETRGIKKWFPIRGRKDSFIKAIDGVSFKVNRGETLGIVGESGCGKSTLCRVLNRLYQLTEGEILFNGEDITNLGRKKLQPLRDKMKMIFQDPYETLDPRMTVREIIEEPLLIRKTFRDKKLRHQRILEVMDTVGLSGEYLDRYPHEFSGGQRQRIGIARAIVQQPELIICDEPVSALDVSIRAKIINLLKNLQKSMGLTYLFISHDLGVVKHISDRIAVMYLGKIVELTDKRELYAKPVHPYTKALLSSIPHFKTRREKKFILTGEIPSPANPPPGCRFCTRCQYVEPRCKKEEPALREISPGHEVACHFVE